MKHLILNNLNIVLRVGDIYSTGTDDLDITKTIHILDNIRYDDSFLHIETSMDIPTDFYNDGIFYKYENDVFVKYDQIIAEQGE